jgi:hypothetical protein
MALGGKAGTQWCSKDGVDNDPITLIIGDSTFRHAAKHPDLVGLHGGDQLIAIWDGRLEHVEPFFTLRPHTYRMVEKIVLLGYGTEDLCLTGLDGIQRPGSSKEQFLKDYIALVNHVHTEFPEAVILSSDPMPQRTTGFGNNRLAYFSSQIAKSNHKHHHLCFAKCFHTHKTTGRQVKKEKFESDGIQVKQDQVRILIDSVHEALAKIESALEDIKDIHLSSQGFSLKF